jgi:aldose sugar dehydrogenase
VLGGGLFFIIAILIFLFILTNYYDHYFVSAYASGIQSNNKGPIIYDRSLKVEPIFKGLQRPTSMAFLGPNDILVLEKDKGTVQRIVNGRILPAPLLDVNVANKNERGMLGIAVAKHQKGPTYVFLYYTEAAKKEGEDVTKGKEPLGNRLYRYELADNKLINPKLLLDLPSSPGSRHNGGRIKIGPDNNIYLVIGDVGGYLTAKTRTKDLNYQNGKDSDGRGGILRITQDGKPVGKGIIGNNTPANKYYAYGIRNSFGIDFDPVTKKLWDTENGPTFGDEINLVEPGFNSGWRKVQGIWEFDGNNKDLIERKELKNPDRLLVDFGGKGKYSSPEFIWYYPVGPTALTFLNSSKLGKQYENDMFVGDINNGYIYHFNLKEKNRIKLALDNPLLEDKIANNENETKSIIFGEGFGENEVGFRGISDIEVGDDGYLYIISFGQGIIYRITPAH